MTREESIKLTIKSLLEVVQTGAKNIEISVLDGYNKITVGFIHSRLRLSNLRSNAFIEPGTLRD